MTARLSRCAGWGMTLAGLCALGVGCASTGSARADYFASRSVVLPAAEGDGSVVATGAAAPDAAWQRSLTLVPLSGPGDLADNR